MQRLILRYLLCSLILSYTFFVSATQAETTDFNNTGNAYVYEKSNVSPMDNHIGRQTALVLNYCDMSLVKILSYKDRVILDEEYNTIVNNINLSAIHDEEVIDLLQILMDAFVSFQLAEHDKDLLQKEYNRLASNAFYDSLIRGGDNLVELMVAVGGTYHSYRRNMMVYKKKFDKHLWQLEKDVQQRLNNLRKKLIKNSWMLIKKYNIPDNWRLTEKQMEYYLTVRQDTDANRRFRRLKEIQDWFTVFPEFWYTFAQTAQEIGDIKTALSLYDKIERFQTNFFRHDYNFSHAMMNKVNLLREIKQNPEIMPAVSDIEHKIQNALQLITKEAPFDWSKNLFSALTYLKLGNIEQAKKLLVKNIDEGKEISLNTRVLGEAYALAKNEQVLSQHIIQMVSDSRVSYQDSLSLVGKIKDSVLLQETIDNVLAPGIMNIQFSLEPTYFGKDSLKVTIPKIWFKQKPKFFNVILKLPEQISDLITQEMTEQKNSITYTFADVIDSDDFIKLQGSKKMAIILRHPIGLVKILVKVETKEVLVNKNIVEQSINSTKQYGTQAFEFVSSYFSDAQEQSTQQETKQSDKKVHHIITFNKREIKVKEDCYLVNISEIKKVKRCRFL